MTKKNELGPKIRARREELGLSQEELARAIGYRGKASINKIELGYADVPRAKLPAFAAALNMTPAEFSGWTKERQQLSFSYCMEQQLRMLGYALTYTTEGDVLITAEAGQYEITEEDVKMMEHRLALFMKMEVDDLLTRSRRL